MHKAADEAVQESTFAEPCCAEDSPLLSLSEALKYVYSIVTQVDRDREESLDIADHELPTANSQFPYPNGVERQSRMTTRSQRHTVNKGTISQQLEADKLEHLLKVFTGRRSLSPNWKFRHAPSPSNIGSPQVIHPAPPKESTALFIDEPETARGRALRSFLEAEADMVQEVILPMLPPALNMPSLTPLKEKDAFQKSTPPLPVRGVDARFHSLLERTATRKLGQRLQQADQENRQVGNQVMTKVQASLNNASQVDRRMLDFHRDHPYFGAASMNLDTRALSQVTQSIIHPDQENRHRNSQDHWDYGKEVIMHPPDVYDDETLSEAPHEANPVAEWTGVGGEDDCYVSVSNYGSQSHSIADPTPGGDSVSEPHFGSAHQTTSSPYLVEPTSINLGRGLSPFSFEMSGSVGTNKRRRTNSSQKDVSVAQDSTSRIPEPSSSSKRRSLVAGVIDVSIPQSEIEVGTLEPPFSQSPSVAPSAAQDPPTEQQPTGRASIQPTTSVGDNENSSIVPYHADESSVREQSSLDGTADQASASMRDSVGAVSAAVEVQEPQTLISGTESRRSSNATEQPSAIPPRGRRKQSKPTRSRKRSCSSASIEEQCSKAAKVLNSPSWVTPRPAPIITVNLDDCTDDVPRPSPSAVITVESASARESEVASNAPPPAPVTSRSRSRASTTQERRSSRRRDSDSISQAIEDGQDDEPVAVDQLALVEEISSRRLASAGVQANVPKSTRQRHAAKPVDPPFGEAPLRRVSIGERPKRLRVPPLQWWRNERIEYEQDSGGHGFRAKAVYLVDSSRVQEDKKKAEKKPVAESTVAVAKGSRKKKNHQQQQRSRDRKGEESKLIVLDDHFDRDSNWLTDVSKIPMKPILVEEGSQDGAEEIIVRAHRWRNVDWVDVHSSEHTGYKVKLLSKSSRIQTCAVQLSARQEKGIDSTGDCRFFLTVTQGENKRTMVTLYGDSKDQECSLSPGDWLVIPPKTKYDIANNSRSKTATILMNIIMNEAMSSN